MIKDNTKQSILEASRIDEVVGDFVSLKKRGSNLLGLCPFHNEKTPSFTVSPAKGFFKCFGCGKAGDSVTFIMEHEHLTFPESLRYLANKYHIEIEETVPTAEILEEQSIRESLFIVSSFAQRYYSEQLWKTESGKAIGLSYFRERGFTEEIINKFQLGYAPDQWASMSTAALAEGYKMEFLEKTGLIINQDGKQYDRFRGRVMFPIHNVTGRVVGFGARILKTDPKSPKYLNSPETDIYQKSKILYGISFAKKEIIQQDLCYLVEGYTDVISLHQAGIENIVASSGTALTVDQIRLISRYSKNVTVLYDGDPAGIKASLRGIDLILEEGLNVRVLLFPHGEDPDSFSRKVSTVELKEFLQKNAVDFISFKTKLLLEEAANDPIKKAALIKDIISTVAKVPDAITRSAYTRQTAMLMEISEQILIQEINKLIRKSAGKTTSENFTQTELSDDETLIAEKQEDISEEFSTVIQEQEIIRILLNYADRPFSIPDPNGETPDAIQVMPVSRFVINELLTDGIHFTDEKLAGLLAEFTSLDEQQKLFEQQEFIQQLNTELKSVAISVLTHPHELSPNWEAHGIIVKTELQNFQKAVIDPVMYLKKKQILKMKKENQELIREQEIKGNTVDELLEKEKILFQLQSEINKYTNTVIQK